MQPGYYSGRVTPRVKDSAVCLFFVVVCVAILKRMRSKSFNSRDPDCTRKNEVAEKAFLAGK